VFPSGWNLQHDQRSVRNAPNLMVRRNSVLVSASGLRCRIGLWHHWGVSVKVADASVLLVALSGTRSGSHREPILRGMNIDSGRNVDCLAHSDEKAGCERIVDEASLGRPAAVRGILAVVGAVGAARSAFVLDCNYHAATAVPEHKLKFLVLATMSPMFVSVGQ
jgi:hypothetical protein